MNARPTRRTSTRGLKKDVPIHVFSADNRSSDDGVVLDLKEHKGKQYVVYRSHKKGGTRLVPINDVKIKRPPRIKKTSEPEWVD